MTVDIAIERHAPDKNVVYITVPGYDHQWIYTFTDSEFTKLMAASRTHYNLYIKRTVKK